MDEAGFRLMRLQCKRIRGEYYRTGVLHARVSGILLDADQLKDHPRKIPIINAIIIINIIRNPPPSPVNMGENISARLHGI